MKQVENSKGEGSRKQLGRSNSMESNLIEMKRECKDDKYHILFLSEI